MSEHRLMPNMLRYVPRDVADQIIADVEDSLWLAEHDATAQAKSWNDGFDTATRNYPTEGTPTETRDTK